MIKKLNSINRIELFYLLKIYQIYGMINMYECA